MTTIENVFGSPFDDTLIGNASSNLLNGGDGSDFIYGGEGGDLVSGEGGTDSVNGEAGDDSVSGGAGDDALNGGTETDDCRGESGIDSAVECEALVGTEAVVAYAPPVGKVADSIVIDAPLAEVWDFYFQAETWPTWVDQFARVGSSAGYPEVGGTLVWESVRAGRGQVTEKVLVHEPRTRHRISFTRPRVRGRAGGPLLDRAGRGHRIGQGRAGARVRDHERRRPQRPHRRPLRPLADAPLAAALAGPPAPRADGRDPRASVVRLARRRAEIQREVAPTTSKPSRT